MSVAAAHLAPAELVRPSHLTLLPRSDEWVDPFPELTGEEPVWQLADLFRLDPLLAGRIEVTDQGNCWLWTGDSVKSHRNKGKRYGRVRRRRVQRGMLMVHRYTYTLLVGAVPEGHVVHHRCRNTLCCNPAHLEDMDADQHEWLHRELAAMAGEG